MLTDILKIVVIFILVFIFYKKYLNTRESFVNYSRCNKIVSDSRLDSIFNEHGFKKDNDNYELYIPCGYTYVEQELRKKVFNKQQHIFAIDGCDRIVSKLYLWKNLKSKFGDSYVNYVPKTYGNSAIDIAKLFKNHKSGTKYIAKKDVQAQTGLHIIHNLSDLKKVVIDNKFLVIQELLNNPFLIKGRKINLRIYFLIVCNKGKIEAYIHNNGFMYYTPEYFNYESNNKHCHITSGYVDRKVYQENPLTIEDFYRYLRKNGHNDIAFKNNLLNLFKKIMLALEVPICNRKDLNTNVRFQLFGADIAPDNNLNVKLIEINKGPDLRAKDKRDNEVKDKVVRDVFDIVGLIKGKTINKFIKVQ